MADLSKELNKGGDITSGLKKVAREETNKDKKISGKVETKEKAVKVTNFSCVFFEKKFDEISFEDCRSQATPAR
jgi:hypothetical protein